MRFLGALLICFTLPAAAAAQDVYPTTPDWTSSDTRVSTGAALVDLDRDGWLDLVVANGNDIAKQPLAVYYNQGDGSFPLAPDWLSTDLAYNGHLDVADVNGDGWPDVAVAVLGRFDDVDPSAKIYLNAGGTLSATPDWQSTEVGNAFGCAFGDVNADGRPDLAVATGWAYTPQNFYPNYVYVNSDGALPLTATWSSDDQAHLQGVLWADADDDGWLDLVGVPNGEDTVIYRNLGGSLETTSTWSTVDSPAQDGIMAVAGDVDGDEIRDLILTDNTQLGGSGRFRQYDGLPGGFFDTSYGWSYFEGNGSAVALADIDADGRLDLATGAWWDKTRLFLNTGSGLPAVPDWSSSPDTVIEKIVFGDIDNRALGPVSEQLPVDGRRLHYLSHQQIHEVGAVRVDGVELSPHEFLVNREFGWLSLGVTPTTSLTIDYIVSLSLDMAVTNWDAVGNFLYINRAGGLIFADGFESGDTSAWGPSQPPSPRRVSGRLPEPPAVAHSMGSRKSSL